METNRLYDITLPSETLLAKFEHSAGLPSHLSNSNAISGRQRSSTSETNNKFKRLKRPSPHPKQQQ